MAGYQGNFAIGSTLDVKFTTVATSGAPFTLAGSPVISAYVDNGTTEITAGITLTVDFDSRTGLNNVRVVATTGNGFAAGTNVSLVITTGTVNSVSVVGYEIGSFSIDNRVVNLSTLSAKYGSYTGQQVLDLIVTSLIGVSSGLTAGAGSFSVKAPDGTAGVVTATVDANGNRTATAFTP